MIRDLVDTFTSAYEQHGAWWWWLVLPALYLIVNEFQRYRVRLRDFDSPLNLPLVGHLPFVRKEASEQYRVWSEKYGPVYQVQLGNVPVLVVNSAEYASKVFISNSHATISRPMFHMFHKVVSTTAGFTIGTSPFDESLKRRRKVAAGALNRPAVQSYVPLIDRETREFIKIALESNGEAIDPTPLVQRMSLNLSLTLNWGTRLKPNDSLLDEIAYVETVISGFRSVTGNLKDYIPILRWIPFTESNRTAIEMRKRRDVYMNKMNDELDERIANKEHIPCIQANVLIDPEGKLNRMELMSISLSMVSGGLDTITTFGQWALAVLAHRPDIQKKAYEEIQKHTDNVLCDAQDDQQCTYVAAFVREVLRLYTPLHLALPKAALEDFYLDGRLVPKGTTLFLNSWACNTDPEVFENPREFDPERFVANMSTPIYAYGYGTRMCAGYMLANRELYLLMMRVISSFEIIKVNEIDMDPLTGVHDTSHLVSQPHPFTIKFKPRNLQKLKHELDSYGEA